MTSCKNILMMRHILLMLFVAMTCCMARAQKQTINVVGHVKDSFTYDDVVGVKVSLLAADSTVLVDSLPSLPTGQGTMYVAHDLPRNKPQTYIIRAVHPDYEEACLRYEMKDPRRLGRIDLPDLMMKKVWKKELGEVEVRATRIKMVMRGDTLVYDARAFNLPAGSMLDALIGQLPGAELKPNGEIFINGRKVDYLMLNSREFFRGNNRVMLDNLPYYTVKDIKVYEKNTDLNNFLGREAEKKDFVMDVNLKREYHTGYLGNTDLGGGTDERYAARLFGLRFSDRTRVTLFAQLNNINQAWAPGAGGDAGWGNTPRDLTTTQYVGCEIYAEGHDKSWRETLKATARWNHTESERNTEQQTFLSDGSDIYGRSWLNSSARSMELHADQIFFKQLPRLMTYSRILFDYNKRKNTMTGDNLTSPDEELRGDTASHSRSEGRTDGHAADLRAYCHLTPKLPWGDELRIEADFSYSSSRSKDYSKRFVRSGTAADYRHDYGDLGGDTYYVTWVAQYTIPTLRGWAVKLSYRPKYEHTQSHDRVFRLDSLEGWNATHDMPLLVLPSVADMMRYCTDVQNSHDYAHRNMSHSMKVGFDYSRGYEGGRKFWMNVLLPVEVLCESARFRQGADDLDMQRTEVLFKPQWEIGFNWREELSRVNMSVQLDMAPADMQLMFPYVNNRDALYVKEGNSRLEAAHIYKWRGGWEHKVKRYAQMAGMQLFANIYRNQLTSGQTYDPETGVYTLRPENVDGNWDAGLEANYNITFGRKRNITFQDKLTGQFLHSVDISAVEGDVVNPLSKVDTYVLGKSLSFDYSEGNLHLRAASGLTWRLAHSRDISAIDWNCGMEGSYTLPKLRTSLQSSLTAYGRGGYGVEQYDGCDWVWNVSVSQPFLKDKLIARIECYDLLHQLSATQYHITAQGRSVTSYRCLPHYVMLHLAYHWNRNPKK